MVHESTPVIWSCSNTREIIPDAVTPLSQALLRQDINQAAIGFMHDSGVQTEPGSLFVDFHHGRLYLNMNFVTHTSSSIPGRSPRQIAAGFGFEDAELLRQHLGIDPDRVTPGSWATLRPTLGTVRYILAAPGYLKKEVPAIESQMDHLETLDLTTLSLGELQALWGEIQGLVKRTTWLHALYSNYAFGLWEPLEGQIRDRFSPQDTRRLMGQLSAGLENMATAQMGLALRRLMHEAHRDEGVRQALMAEDPLAALAARRAQGKSTTFFAAWDEFMARFGHRTFSELDLHRPRWREAPLFLVRLIQGALAGPLGETPEALMEEQLQRRLAAVQEVEQRIGRLRALPFRWLLRNIQMFVTQRENMKNLWMREYALLRQVFLQIAARWQAQGWLDEPDDIFFLVPDEIAGVISGTLAGAELRALVARRRAEFARWQALELPETFVGEWQPQPTPEAPSPASAAGAVLHGLGCSPGTVRAPARIIRDPVREAHRLHPGEVLVAPQTDPIWTILFQSAAAVVTERGGMLSHSAIVAREFGIPAVLGVKEATTRIPDGQLIAVDGTAGTVHIIPEPLATI